ncbi:MAG: glycosidase [Bacteroidales bacterium]|nr:glycosidase [Bacteroidales bacterium]
MKLTKYEHNPILTPNPDNGWENFVTCNPGVIWDDGLFHMLYRAAGDDEEHRICFGHAVSEDGFHFRRVSDRPAFYPSDDGPDSGSVEDARIVKFGDTFYITYAYRPFPPGRYWTFPHDVVRLPECDGFAPKAWAKSMGNTGLAMTRDFKSFRRLGRLTKPTLDDRDVILFPEKVGGRYVMLHRPKEYVGPGYGVSEPSIWIKFSDDLLDWEDKESHLLITGRPDSWEEKIGGSTPPILTSRGWLVLYHGVADGGTADYSAGALLLDRDDPLKVLARTPEPILAPDLDYERDGLYPGCLFPTGNVVLDGTLYVYYGCADKNVCVATCRLDDLLDFLVDECSIKR